MKDTHHITLNVSELKTKDEIDVPLEQMKFKEHVPDSIRVSVWLFLSDLLLNVPFHSFVMRLPKICAREAASCQCSSQIR